MTLRWVHTARGEEPTPISLTRKTPWSKAIHKLRMREPTRTRQRRRWRFPWAPWMQAAPDLERKIRSCLSVLLIREDKKAHVVARQSCGHQLKRGRTRNCLTGIPQAY